ncbi:MAG TPA: YicC family protein [Nitrospirae bacterium]|nr:YicC family protein [Nitrospirota bacterium]
MQSMTGFGSSQRGYYKVDIRSLNSKHMDINFRIPSNLFSYEFILRERLKENFSRGKFDVTISFTQNSSSALNLNKEGILNVQRALKELKTTIGSKGNVSIDSILLFKDLIFTVEQTISEDDLFYAFDNSVKILKDMRIREGLNTRENLIDILNHIETLMTNIKLRYKEYSMGLNDRILKRLEPFKNISDIDETRLYQESAILAQKLDINEELERLTSHLDHFRGLLNQDVVGRRLDFLLQEILREVNTISQKSEDMEIIKSTIEIKAQIDKLKEQVQNIQ